MKNIRLLITLAFIFAVNISFSQGYKIKVRVENSTDSIMYLVNYLGENQFMKDTVKNQGKGVFIFEGDKELPQGIYLAVPQNKNSYFEFLVTDDQKFSMTTRAADMVGAMEVKGSDENKYFYDFLQFSAPKNERITELHEKVKRLGDTDSIQKKNFRNEMDSLNKLITEYKEKLITDHPESFMAQVYQASRDPEVPDAPEGLSEEEKKIWQYNYFVEHYFDYLDLTDERMLHTPVLHQRVSNFINNVIIQDADTVIQAADRLLALARGNKEVEKYLKWYITYNAERSEVMGMDKVFVHMVDNYFGEEKTPWLNKKVLKNLRERADILRNLLIGVEAPNMLLVDTAGNHVALHSIEAKYLVVYFYESDCGHCRRETPKLKKVYDDMKDEGLKVYAVFIDRQKPGEWKKYIKKHHLDWINVYDGRRWTSFHNIYDLTSTPTIYLLDENKKILAKRINTHQLRKFVERKVKEEEENASSE